MVLPDHLAKSNLFRTGVASDMKETNNEEETFNIYDMPESDSNYGL